MSHRLTSILGVVAAGALVVASGSAALAGAAADAVKRIVYVSVLDKDHVPVTDMQAADFEVKEGGKTMEIVSVKRATTPLRIAIIDSDAGTGAYQQGVLQFMQKLLDNAEFSITSVMVQPTKVVDYTSDTAALSKALDGIGRRGTVTGGAQVMEAIHEVVKTVRAEGKRSVIVVMRYGPEGTSSLDPKDVREELRKSGAILQVLSFRGMDRVSTGPTNQNSMNSYTQQVQLRESERAEGQQNLQLVLGDGARESGGHHEQIVSVSVSKSAELLADELLNQYEVTYAVPDGTKPSDKLSVSTKRKNVNVYAPNRPPQ